MKVLILTQYFGMDEDCGSDRYYHFSKKLIELGHHVTVITSNVNRRISKPRYSARRFQTIRKIHRGIEIYYVYSFPNNHGHYYNRILNFLSYYIFSIPTVFDIREKEYDVVFAISVPLTVGVLGYFCSKILNASFIFEVTDVWPDVFIEMGYLKNKMLIALLKQMEIFCYKKAKHIVALSEGMKKNIAAKMNHNEKISFIPNGFDKNLFTLDEEQIQEAIEIRKKAKLENQFVCMYLGAHGLYNSLNTIIEAANILKFDEDIYFIFVGDGNEKSKLKQKAENYQLKNIIFFPPVPKHYSPIWYQVADIFLLPNLKGKFYEMNLQNKFFDFLASAKPIVFAGRGESAEIIQKAKSGIIVEPESPCELADAILKLKLLPFDEKQKMGVRGRNYVLKNYERNYISQKMIDIIGSKL